MAEGELVLPIHDSFLSRKGYAYRLREMMFEAYTEELDQQIGIKIDVPFPLEPQITFINPEMERAPQIANEIMEMRRALLRGMVVEEGMGGYRARNNIAVGNQMNWPLDAH